MSRKKVPLATEYGARVSQVSGKRGKGRRTSRVLPSLRRLAESNDFTAGELSCGFAPKLAASTMCWNPTDTSSLFDHYRVVFSIAAIAFFVCASGCRSFWRLWASSEYSKSPHLRDPRPTNPAFHLIFLPISANPNCRLCQCSPWGFLSTFQLVSLSRGIATRKTEASEFDSCATAAQP